MPYALIRVVKFLGRSFQVLADTTRVRILDLLLNGERNVSDPVDALGIQQGRGSSHLACLTWCGFIAARRDGKLIYYRVTDGHVRDLMNLARGLLADNAGEVASSPRLEDEAAS